MNQHTNTRHLLVKKENIKCKMCNMHNKTATHIIDDWISYEEGRGTLKKE